MKVAILGTGAYGIALASVFNENKHEVHMWTKFEEEKNTLCSNRIVNSLDNYKIPEEIIISNDMRDVIDNASLIVIAVPTAFVDDTTKELKNYLKKDQYICVASKGIEQGGCRFVYDIVYDNLKTKKIGIISGPSFAIDVVKGVPIALALGCKNRFTSPIIKKGLENDHFKLRTTTDIVGIEICGAVKNVLAIASGIIDGMGYPISTKALLITEALHDIKELIHGLGGKKNTILSFAGFGDIYLTCSSDKSRNYTFGKMLATNSNNHDTFEYLENTTVEGVYTLKSIYKLIKTKKIKIPAIDLIYDIVYEGKNPETLLKFLIEK